MYMYCVLIFPMCACMQKLVFDVDIIFLCGLRAEMHLPTVSVRYGLMLEAYCRGCGKYRETLSEQVGF